MIGRLSGRLLRREPDRLLIDVSGVGYEVHVPLSTFYATDGASNEPVSVLVHTYVREDTLRLFGFSTEAERSTFETLLGIAGVGPRMALAILSGIGVDDLRGAVVAQDRARLQKIPGVGRKTAERLMLELRDRLDLEPAVAAGGRAEDAPAGSVTLDAVSALVNLGYGADVARRSVERASAASKDDEPTLEELLRGALSGLVR